MTRNERMRRRAIADIDGIIEDVCIIFGVTAMRETIIKSILMMQDKLKCCERSMMSALDPSEQTVERTRSRYVRPFVGNKGEGRPSNGERENLFS